MFAPSSFNYVSFNPVSWKGLTADETPVATTAGMVAFYPKKIWPTIMDVVMLAVGADMTGISHKEMQENILHK